MLRDRFVLGLNDSDMQRKHFMEQSLMIKTAVDMARQIELIKSQMRSQPASVAVHEVNEMGGCQVQWGRGNSIGCGRGNQLTMVTLRVPGLKWGLDTRDVVMLRGQAPVVVINLVTINCGYHRQRDGEKCTA